MGPFAFGYDIAFVIERTEERLFLIVLVGKIRGIDDTCKSEYEERSDEMKRVVHE